MSATIPRMIARSTIARGLTLAERRRFDLIELHASGRWRMYFPEDEFLRRLRDVMNEVDVWARMLARSDESRREAAPRTTTRLALAA